MTDSTISQQMEEQGSDVTYDLGLLEKSKKRWDESPALRCFYSTLYQDVLDRLAPGDTLEIGSGIGVFKDFLPQVITSDIDKTEYVDRGLNCYQIADDSDRSDWGNITAMDVLHHLQRPFRFFQSSADALRSGGRIILIEPAATLAGKRLYRICHHEPIVPERLNPPFEFPPDSDEGDFANMGMSVALFEKHRAAVDERLGQMGLKVIEHSYRDVFAYFTTGGFSRPSLLPVSLLKAFLKVEKSLPQGLLRFVGLRSITVIEKE